MTFSDHQQVHVHSHKLTYLNFQPSPHPPTHSYPHAKALITANIKQTSSELCNIKPYVGSVSFPHCLFPLSSFFPSLPTSLSLPQRFGVLQMSLAPCSFRPTLLTAAKSIFEDNLRCAAPWWLGFDAAAPPSVPPTLTRDRFTCHRYLTRKSAKCTSHIFNTTVQAGQPCSRADEHSSTFANLWEGRRVNSLRGLKVSWRDFVLPYSPLMRCYTACKFSRYKWIYTVYIVRSSSLYLSNALRTSFFTSYLQK